MDGVIPYDVRFFESLDRMVQAEPWLERDRASLPSFCSRISRARRLNGSASWNWPPGREESGEFVEASGNGWVIRTQRLLLNFDGAPQEKFNLSILALILIDGGESLEGGSQR